MIKLSLQLSFDMLEMIVRGSCLNLSDILWAAAHHHKDSKTTAPLSSGWAGSIWTSTGALLRVSWLALPSEGPQRVLKTVQHITPGQSFHPRRTPTPSCAGRRPYNMISWDGIWIARHFSGHFACHFTPSELTYGHSLVNFKGAVCRI